MNRQTAARTSFWNREATFAAGAMFTLSMGPVQTTIAKTANMTQGIDVSGQNTTSTHPLASVIGSFDDEPLWDDFMAAMQEYRREMNEQGMP